MAVALFSSAALAESRNQNAGDNEDGYPVIVWVGAVATNIFYLPAKVVYAGAGGLVGGLGWIVTGGDTEAANRIWDPAVGGTYIITPAMLAGDEEAHFLGP